MNIRRFHARTVSGALEMVKAEMGPDAVIMSTRRRQKKDPATGRVVRMVEVTAAVDNDVPAKDLVRADLHVPAGRLDTRACGNPPLLVLHEVFSGLGIEPWLQQALAADFLHDHGKKDPVSARAVLAWLGRYGLDHVQAASHAETARLPVWWAVVGTTGVGKTTTLAKLAARLRFKRGLNGVLVTTDTYRLGAVEQIRRYAELMELPLEVAREPKDLVRIFASHRDKDFVLVDTIGRSVKDPRHERELGRVFEAVPGLKALVLLPATAKSQDVRGQIRYYSRFSTLGWTITKVDETAHYGPLFTPIISRQISISYITNGQKVPEDMVTATPELIMRLLLSSRDEEGPPPRPEAHEVMCKRPSDPEGVLSKESV